jgi:hypothetical protein
VLFRKTALSKSALYPTVSVIGPVYYIPFYRREEKLSMKMSVTGAKLKESLLKLFQTFLQNLLTA